MITQLERQHPTLVEKFMRLCLWAGIATYTVFHLVVRVPFHVQKFFQRFQKRLHSRIRKGVISLSGQVATPWISNPQEVVYRGG